MDPFHIIITGPESSGKSTLALDLAHHFRCSFVGEYARSFLDNLNRPYQQSDILQIAEAQFLLHQQIKKRNVQPIIFDTGLLVLKIWLQEKYESSIPWINNELLATQSDLYLLCAPDIPWEADPQRENELDRYRLFDSYQYQLTQMEKDFVVVQGSPEERVAIALNAIEYKKNLIHS